MSYIYSNPEIKNNVDKPIAAPNKGFPYVYLEDRRFEELLYSVYKQEIGSGDWKGKFDDINLLQGVRDSGRDCSLHFKGKSFGLIQCKHSKDKIRRISKPEVSREIIKFVLHYIVDKTLIEDINDFTYYFAVSYGFSEPALGLLNNFNEEVLKQKELQLWFDNIINSNERLKSLKYYEIEDELKAVLKAIKVKKIIPQDLDLLLNKPESQSLVTTFFEVKTVIDVDTVLISHEGILDEIQKLKEYSEESNIPLDRILEKFRQVSFHLANYKDEFETIPDSHIKRVETTQLIHWIRNPIKLDEKPIALLVGNAGSGKTVILKDILLELQELNIPVIGLKADRQNGINLSELEKKINLEDSFERVCKSMLNEYDRVVLLIDQLDALSQSLSSRRDYIDTYTQLIISLSSIEGIRIVISVRSYDLNYDGELSFYKKQTVFSVSLLTKEQIKPVLNKLKVPINTIPDNLIQLLRTPHHLNVFCKISSSQIELNTLKTLQDLYDNLWQQKVLTLPESTTAISEKCKIVIFEIAGKIYEIQNLCIPTVSLIDKYKNELEYLKSNEILTEVNNELQFFHQTFYDYSFAKQFVESNKSVIDYLIENNQELKIRSSLKMIIKFLRDYDPDEYIEVYNELLLNDEISVHGLILNYRYRFHLKLLLINLLGFEEEPTRQEIDIVINKLFRKKGAKLLLLESSNSPGWLRIYISKGIISNLLFQNKKWFDILLNSVLIRKINGDIIAQNYFKYLPYEKRLDNDLNLCFKILVSQLPKERKLILEFLNQLTEFKNKPRLIFRVLYFLKIWDDDIAFQLFEKYDSEAEKDRFGYFKILEDAAQYRIDWVIKIYKIYLLKRINKTQDPTDKSKFQIDDEQLFEKLYQTDPSKTFDFAIEIIKDILNQTSSPDKNELYADLAFYFFDYDKTERTHGYDTVLHLVIDEIEKLAQIKSPKFDEFIIEYKNSNSQTMLLIIIFGFLANTTDYKDEIFDFIEHFHLKFGFKDNSKIQYYLRKLLTNSYPNFTNEQKEYINQIIFAIKTDRNSLLYTDQTTGQKKFNLRFYGYDKYIFLKAIPENEIFNQPILKKEYLELRRKHGEVIDKEPNRVYARGVPAPLKSSSYAKMNFNDWEESFLKYDNDGAFFEYGPQRGSALEHSRAFQKEVSIRPDFFSPFIERLIIENKVPNQYTIKGLEGLKEGKYDPNEFKRLYKLVLNLSLDKEQTSYLIWLSDYLIEQKIIDYDLVQYLAEMAVLYPDPESDRQINDSLNDGINTIRGAAASRLIKVYYNPDFKDIIFSTLNKVIDDKVVSVRVSIMPNLALLMNLDEEKTFNLFLKAVNTGHPEILKYSIRSAQYLINNNFSRMQDYFIKSINTESIHENIAVVLAQAWLKGKKGSNQLIKKLIKKSAKVKAKMVEVAVTNLFNENEYIRSKCEKLFLKFLNNRDDEIVQQYSIGFLHFPPEKFNALYPLLKKFAHSKIATREPHHYFEFLLKCAKSHPKECIVLISLFKFDKNVDISKRDYSDDEPVKALIGAYNALKNNDKADKYYIDKSMRTFDKMLKNERFRASAGKVIEQVEM